MQKKTRHPIKQNRPDIRSERLAWFAGQLELEPELLVLFGGT